MAIITQNSRISHHTLTGVGMTFSVPLQEDFTLRGSTMSWTSSDLALSEIGVNEYNGTAFIRVGSEIKELQFTTASTTPQTALTQTVSTRTDTVEVDVASLNFGTGIKSIDGSTESNMLFTPSTITVSNNTGTGIEYDIDYSATYTNRSLVDKEYVDTHGGGGGTQSLEQTLAIGNTTGTYSIVVDNSSEIIFGTSSGLLFNNTSRLREGTIDAGYGGNKGIAQICAVGYEMKWESGSLYIMNGDGTEIREVRYTFGATPLATDDVTKGFTIGSRWVLDNGDLYTCSDTATSSAVWDLVATGVGNLEQTLAIGNTTGANDIIVDNDIRIKTTDTGFIQFGDTGADLNAISVNNGGDGVTTPSNGFGFSGVDPYWTSQVTDIAGIIDTISLDPQGLVNGTGIKSENTTTTDYSQTTHTPNSITTTITDNGYGYFSSKEIKPQQHQSQFSPQANIFVTDDKRAGWMQTSDDTTALMIYCDMDPTGSTSSIVQIKAHVRGISSDKMMGYAAEITSWVRVNPAEPYPVTQIGTVDYVIKSEFTTAHSSFVISGPNMYIDVTGEVGITIDWTCNVELLYDKNTF